MLAELALLGAIEAGKGWWKRTRVVLDDDAAPVSDPVLAGALDAIGEKPRSPEDLVHRLGKNLPDQLCTRLVERGILRREESRILGLFPRTRWPAADSRHEAALRGALQRALIQGEGEGADPGERVATVIAVLLAADVLTKVVDRGPLSKRALKARAEQIADAGWASEAVRQAIRAAQTAVAAAVTASTAVAATSAS